MYPFKKQQAESNLSGYCTEPLSVYGSERRILYIYCPASVKYRANLEKQPAFTDAAAQYERDRQKKIKELKGFNSNVTKRGGTITKVLEDNLAFYEDM